MMSRANKQILRLAYNQGAMGELGKITAQRIREAREAANLTQVDLAEYLGITRDAVSKIENGRSALTLRHLEKLPEILNYPIEYFLNIDMGLSPQEEQLLATYRRLPKTGPHRAGAVKMIQALVDAIYLHSDDEWPELM